MAIPNLTIDAIQMNYVILTIRDIYIYCPL